MAVQYKILKADSETELTTAMNEEVVNGYSAVGSLSCAVALDTLNASVTLYTILMARKSE